MMEGQRQTPALIVSLLAAGWTIGSGLFLPLGAGPYLAGLALIVLACAAVVGRRPGPSVLVAAVAVLLALLATLSLLESRSVAAYVARGGGDAQAGLGGILIAFAGSALVGLLVVALLFVWVVELWAGPQRPASPSQPTPLVPATSSPESAAARTGIAAPVSASVSAPLIDHHPPAEDPATAAAARQRLRNRRLLIAGGVAAVVLTIVAIVIANYDPAPWAARDRRIGLTSGQRNAAMRAWRATDGIVLVDAAGTSFLKSASWQMYRGPVSIKYSDDERSVSTTDWVAGVFSSTDGEPQGYIGEVFYEFNRHPDGKWFLDLVRLPGANLTSTVSLPATAGTAHRSPEPEEAAIPLKGLLSDEAALEALRTWLNSTRPVSLKTMKIGEHVIPGRAALEPGGIVVAMEADLTHALDPEYVYQVRHLQLDNVTVRLGGGRAATYRGRADADFVGFERRWYLNGIWLTDLVTFPAR